MSARQATGSGVHPPWGPPVGPSVAGAPGTPPPVTGVSSPLRAGLLAAGTLLLLVALRQGALWLAVLGCGLLAPALLSRALRPRLERLSFCFRGPERAVSGQLVQHELHAHNRTRRASPPVRVVHSVRGFEDVTVSVPALPAGGKATVTVLRCAVARGVGELHTLRATSGAPFGLVRWGTVVHALSRLVVYPRAVSPEDTHALGDEGDVPAGVVTRSGVEAYGVRDYVHGDPVRQVHWRASAKYGRLVVVEPERTVARRVALLVAGVSPPPGAPSAGTVWEDALARAAWSVAALLAEGGTAELYAVQAGLDPLRTQDPQAALDWFAALDQVLLPTPEYLEPVLGRLAPGDALSVLATPQVPPWWWDLARGTAARLGRSLTVSGWGGVTSP